MVLNIVLGAVGGVCAALGTIYVARRLRSGQIATSTAEQLWEKTNKIESDLHVQLAMRDARIAALEARNEILDQERQALRNEHTNLRIEHASCESRLAISENETRSLTARLAILEATVTAAANGGHP